MPTVWCRSKGQTETWANHLADTILADTDRFDIIVLNEAWDEDAKSILVRRLRSVYPNFVRKIDADLIQIRGPVLQAILSGQPTEVLNGLFGLPIEKINGEDSGLMFFANRKFGFLPLPDPSFKWGTAPTQALEASTPEVAFTLFESCANPDCFSAKGAGLVRLRHLSTGRIYNIVFTHTQADYPDENEFHTAARAKQFVQVHNLVETTLAPLAQREQSRERLLMMGDLNVAVLSSGTAEWKSLFDTAGSFFTRPLYDAWARTTSPQDTGTTNAYDKERLDYIVSFPERYEFGQLEGPVCVQHMTIPVDFQLLESDHYMVHADLNIGFFHCHPQIAYEITLEPAQNPTSPPVEVAFIDLEGGQDVTAIKWPGAMQWFHVRKGEAGTYSIGRTNPDVVLAVFAPDDLTTSISRYNKATQIIAVAGQRMFVDTFVLPREFYIRTSGSSRSLTGDYALAIKRHTCWSQAEACILQPGQKQSATLTKSGNPFGTQNQAWFQFDVTGTSDSGVDQTITLTADGLPDPLNFKGSLQGFLNTSGMGPPPQQQAGQSRSYVSKMGDGSSGYLVIEQVSPTAENVTVTALMNTSLRLLDVFNLICEDETNPEFGSDDIYTIFTVDGVSMRAPASGEVEFDCDEPRDEKPWGPVVGKPTITFVENVGIRVIEDDDTSPNDSSRFNLLPALGVNDIALDGLKNPLVWKFEGGEYRFTFKLRKRPNMPVK